MAHWWITFKDRAPACVGMATYDEAIKIAKEHGEVTSCNVLPYPASPRLDDKEGWGPGQHPSFCHDPEFCKGRTACPKSRACDD
jgi:hypothetical protein